jgi:hypothetical protein
MHAHTYTYQPIPCEFMHMHTHTGTYMYPGQPLYHLAHITPCGPRAARAFSCSLLLPQHSPSAALLLPRAPFPPGALLPCAPRRPVDSRWPVRPPRRMNHPGHSIASWHSDSRPCPPAARRPHPSRQPHIRDPPAPPRDHRHSGYYRPPRTHRSRARQHQLQHPLLDERAAAPWPLAARHIRPHAYHARARSSCCRDHGPPARGEAGPVPSPESPSTSPHPGPADAQLQCWAMLVCAGHLQLDAL